MRLLLWSAVESRKNSNPRNSCDYQGYSDRKLWRFPYRKYSEGRFNQLKSMAFKRLLTEFTQAT